MNLELYSYWRSSASYRVRIALNLKSLPYVMHAVNLMKDGGEQFSAAYRAVNPQSRVPTLVHDGQRFTQSLAIIEYLDEIFPDQRLIPRDPVDRARVRMLSQIIACDIQPLQNTSTTQYLKDKLQLDEAGDHRRGCANGSRAGSMRTTRTWSAITCPASSPTAIRRPWRIAASCRSCSPLRASASRSRRYPRLALIAENCAALSAFQHAHPSKQPDAA